MIAYTQPKLLKLKGVLFLPTLFVLTQRFTVLAGFNNAMTILITDVIKVFVGAPRPHFLGVCALDSAELAEICGRNASISTTDCPNSGSSELLNAQLSFPSGHSSAVCATVVFLVVG